MPAVEIAVSSSLPPSNAQVAQIAFVLLLVLTASGCTRLLYNRLDSVAGWYLQGLVSLDEGQRTDLKSWLEQTLDWHRQSELARYSQFLRSLAGEVSQPGIRATYERAEQQIEGFWKSLAVKAAPDAARLLTDLSPAQVEELEASLEEKARERADEAEEEVAAGKWHEQRAKSMQRQLRRWTGRVTAEQKALVQEVSLSFSPRMPIGSTASASGVPPCGQRWSAPIRAMRESNVFFSC